MRTLLVLEGGALRGIYTAGVIDVLLKEKISVDTIIGVSMGSLIGINYCSNQPGRALHYNKQFCKDKNYISYTSFLKTGDVVNQKLAYDLIPNEYDKFDYETYQKSKTNLYCTVTNLETGEAEYIEITDPKKQTEYLRAGASMPGLSKIVEIDDKKYLDGGIADSIPLKKALSMGFDRIILVLTRPIEYRKKNSEMKMMQRLYKKYPAFQKTIQNRNKVYNETVEEILKEEKKGTIFVIRPTKQVNIKRIEHNPDKIQEQYDLGVEDCKNRLRELKEYLKVGDTHE